MPNWVFIRARDLSLKSMGGKIGGKAVKMLKNAYKMRVVIALFSAIQYGFVLVALNRKITQDAVNQGFTAFLLFLTAIPCGLMPFPTGEKRGEKVFFAGEKSPFWW